MSEADAHPGTALRARVGRLARQRWWLTLLGGGLATTATVAAGALLLIGADHGLDLPPALRLLGLLGLIVLSAAALILLVLRRLLAGARLEAAARAIERQAGVTDNRVINGCQLSGRELGRDAAACAATIAAAGAEVVDGLDRQAFLGLRGLINGVFLLAMLGLAWGAYAATYPHHLRHAAERVLYPLRPSGVIGDAVIAVEPRGEVRRYAGGAVTLRAAVTALGDEEVLIDPVLVVGEVGGEEGSGERLPMALSAEGYTGVARELRRDRVLSVEALGARSAPLSVRVVPPPVATAIAFAVRAPEYAGAAVNELPGPDLDLLAGSTVQIDAAVDGHHDGLTFAAGGEEVALTRAGDRWRGELAIEASGGWQLRAVTPDPLRDPASDPWLVLASGGLRIAPDQLPEVRIDVVERNAFLAPGSELELPVVASDDLGLRMLAVTATDSVDTAEHLRLATWPYLAPGRKGPVRERLSVTLDPRFFVPGRSYVIRAEARDYRPPSGQLTRSEPVVVRILQAQQLDAEGDGAFRQALAALKEAIAAQDRARGRTAQVRANRPPPGPGLDAAAAALAEGQAEATAALEAARDALAAAGGAGAYAPVVTRLLRGDTALATHAIDTLTGRPPALLDPALGLLRRHQDEVFVRLVALLGRISDDRRVGDDAPGDTQRLAEELRDHLRDIHRQQQRLAERSATMAEQLAADGLELGLEALLAARGREQDQLLLLLELRGDDIASLPQEAVTIAATGTGWERVGDEMRLAGDALFAFDPEAARPRQAAAGALAEQLLAALEAWLAALPREERWAGDPADAEPEGEELEAIVGKLLDDLEGMGPPPGSAEAELAAALDPEAEAATDALAPLEIGAVDGMAALGDDDRLQDPEVDPLDPTSAPPPPELRQRMQRLAEQQTGIRQQAAEIAMELRRRGYPSGDLEAAVSALQRVAEAAQRGDAVDLRQAHSAAVDAIGRANRQVATEARVRRERAASGTGRRPLSIDAVRDQIPKGYEAMVERYFQALQGQELP